MPKEKNEIATFEKELEPFFKRNPHPKVQKRGKFYYVMNPWNDESVAFILRGRSQFDLIAALNNLILPPRFTALYHLDSNVMEYIYTLLDKDEPCFAREFEFIMEGKTYHCKFGQASERLLILSSSFRRTKKQSGTDYRNLLLLREYVESLRKKRPPLEDFPPDIKPISFYASGFKHFDENEIIEVSKHLNFFMQYYDRDSPYILIHSVESEPLETPEQLQLIETVFPEKISTRRQDPFLLDLALVAITSTVESRLQFLYYYQILEYAAFYYIGDDVRRELLKIINTPDIQSNPDRCISRILDTASDIRQTEETKLNKIVETRCSPDIVWKELQNNMSYFTKKQEFDGGFVLEPFISEDTTLESFCAMWYPNTPETLRMIRNALVHAREKRFGRVISPTPHNDLLIKPWVAIARRIAEQVIIFSRVT